jgi:hypothetical protein
VWEGFDRGRASIPLAQLGKAKRIRLRVTVQDGFTSSSATTKLFKVPSLVNKAFSGPEPSWLVDLQRDGIQLVNP